MIEFWLGTFQLTSPVAGPTGLSAASGPVNLAVEVLRDGTECAVLFSSVDDLRDPRYLTCKIGFTNSGNACNVWRDRGFPLVDAAISQRRTNQASDIVSVLLPCFHQASSMDYEATFVELSGFVSGAAAAGARTTLSASYNQEFQAPDTAQPDVSINRREVTWSPRRTNVHQISAGSLPRLDIDLGKSPARFPTLEPLSTKSISLTSAWVGTLDLPATGITGNVLQPLKVSDVLGDPVFRFENVEVLGFRIDLAGLGRDFTRDLAALIAPLNFHLRRPDDRTGRRPLLDFRYENAAPTLLIELLRYGRMSARAPNPPLKSSDFQSQHELVVRLLVGRLDDDSARAYAPAVYVPAIFVDNPWSKIIGRCILGYDKLMAQFCVQDGRHAVPLRPDGRVPGHPGDPPRALGDISRINLVDIVGEKTSMPLLDLDLPSQADLGSGALKWLNLNSPFGLSALAMLRWRMMDFESPEFLGSFAARAVWESIRAFRCVQVAPMVDHQLEETWVSGRFVVDPDIRVGLPLGVAKLTLRALPSRGQSGTRDTRSAAWNRLCQMLGDGTRAELRLPPGCCYRLVASMDLTVEDGLSWTPRTRTPAADSPQAP